MISFDEILEKTPIEQMVYNSSQMGIEAVERAMQGGKALGLDGFLALISPAAESRLEEMAQAAHALTAQRFGRVIQLYAPLYISNKCNNGCLYCGFRQGSLVERITLSPDEVMVEAELLKKEGFQHILLVSGEYAPEINIEYFRSIIKGLRKMFHSISVEIAPLSLEDYKSLYGMGVEGVTSYQEIYEHTIYKKYHPTGKKSNFEWRITTPERAGKAGIRKIGVGSLLGLNDWRYEAICLYHHIRHLTKHFWKSQISLSFPRLQDFGADFGVPCPVKDSELAQMICAMRLAFPDLVLTLSTRENQFLRDGLVKLGITQMSAGSKTDPGGYSNHNETNEQFEIQDDRSPEEVAKRLHTLGYDAVWKDWEGSLGGYSHNC